MVLVILCFLFFRGIFESRSFFLKFTTHRQPPLHARLPIPPQGLILHHRSCYTRDAGKRHKLTPTAYAARQRSSGRLDACSAPTQQRTRDPPAARSHAAETPPATLQPTRRRPAPPTLYRSTDRPRGSIAPTHTSRRATAPDSGPRWTGGQAPGGQAPGGQAPARSHTGSRTAPRSATAPQRQDSGRPAQTPDDSPHAAQDAHRARHAPTLLLYGHISSDSPPQRPQPTTDQTTGSRQTDTQCPTRSTAAPRTRRPATIQPRQQDSPTARHAPTLDKWTARRQRARHDPRQDAASVIVYIYIYSIRYMNYINSSLSVNSPLTITDISI